MFRRLFTMNLRATLMLALVLLGVAAATAPELVPAPAAAQQDSLEPTECNDYTGSHPTIQVGDTGAAVRHAQCLVSMWGWDSSSPSDGDDPTSIIEDGIFGGDTERAVEYFQNQSDLEADGIVGPQTWEMLHDALLEKESH